MFKYAVGIFVSVFLWAFLGNIASNWFFPEMYAEYKTEMPWVMLVGYTIGTVAGVSGLLCTVLLGGKKNEQ